MVTALVWVHTNLSILFACLLNILEDLGAKLKVSI